MLEVDCFLDERLALILELLNLKQKVGTLFTAFERTLLQDLELVHLVLQVLVLYHQPIDVFSINLAIPHGSILS